MSMWKLGAMCVVATAGLSGCIVYVNDASRVEGWSYREGSALELKVRPHEARDAGDGGPPLVGTWTGEGTFARPPAYSQRYYALEVRNDPNSASSRRLEVRSLEDIEGLPEAGKQYDERRVALRLHRDAGTLIFEGEKEGDTASGNVRFARDEAYAANVAALAGRAVETPELASLAFTNVRRDDVEELRAANVTMAPAEIIRMRDNGISGKFMRELNATGRTFNLDEAIKLRSHGVTPEYVKNLRDAGLDASVDQVIRLRNNGVSSKFVKGLAGPDGTLPPLDEIIRLRNSGVSTEYIANLRAAGYNFDTGDVIKLSHASVSSSYAKGIKEAGYDLNADQLIKLRNAGVSSQYVKDLQDPGYTKLSIEQIIEARNRGLSADFVKKLRRRE